MPTQCDGQLGLILDFGLAAVAIRVIIRHMWMYPMVEGYCVKCKKMVTIKNPEQVTLKNGRPAVRGVCPETGITVYRIGATL